MNASTAYQGTVILVMLGGSSWLFGVLRKAGRSSRISEELQGALADLVAELMQNIRKLSSADKAMLRTKSLQCILHEAKETLGLGNQHWANATLFFFPDDQAMNLHLVAKVDPTSSVTRSTDRTVSSETAAAFYVAKAGKHRAIADFWNQDLFPKVRLSSNEKPKYRSVLIVPIIKTYQDSKSTCLGVLTLDTSKPYAFWHAEERVVKRIDPYLEVLAALRDAEHCEIGLLSQNKWGGG
ncbi:GAF domain-containing protein [Planctomycetes bacterium Pan216]